MTVTATPARSLSAAQSAVLSGIGVVIAFIEAVIFLHGLGSHSSLGGVDAVLGIPSVAVSIIFFAALVAANVTRLAGADYPHPWFVALSVVTGIGTVYQLVVVFTAVSWFSVVLAVLALAVLALTIRSTRVRSGRQTTSVPGDRAVVLGVFLILAGLAGLTAAMNLTFDDVNLSITGLKQSCDFSAFAQCSKNLGSWEGSLFGFPNPLIGLGAFTVPIVTGVAVLFRVQLPRWYWVAFNVCIALAFLFVAFLIYTSVFVIGTLCVWCLLVWTFTIPTFWLVSLRNLSLGNVRVGPRATRFFGSAYSWVPIISLVCYVIVFTLFQVQLDVLQYV